MSKPEIKVVARDEHGNLANVLIDGRSFIHGSILDKESARLRIWIDDLQSGLYVNCVYCGHRYGPGETTPVSMADALKEHIENCPEHPMSRLKKQIKEALETAGGYGGIDGAHHKMWVIDQMVRNLTGADYQNWVKFHKMGKDGPETYEWDEGIAP